MNTDNIYNINNNIKFSKITEVAITPTRAHKNDAGLDLYVHSVTEDMTYEHIEIGFGICVEIPKGFFGLLIPRSSTSKKLGLQQINGAGIIDSDYRGELKAYYRYIDKDNDNYMESLINIYDKAIAQLVIIPCALPELIEVKSLSETERGKGGFGSTTKT